MLKPDVRPKPTLPASAASSNASCCCSAMPQRKTRTMTVLETERLILRMFREEDFEQYSRICADAEVTRYLGEGRPLERWEAWRQIAVIIGHWQLRGYGIWAV